MYDLIIIGGGAAALSAAVYAKRFNLKFLVIAKYLGGTATQAWVVDNYLGFQHIMGMDIANKFVEHAKSLNIEIVESEVKSIKKGKTFVVEAEKKYEAKSVILATGTKRRKLNVPGEDKFANKGVVYCATCLPPNESVIINNSISEIKNVTPVSRVLTIDGSYQNISGFMKRKYKGNLVKIRPRHFNESVSLTPNHPVYSLKVTKGKGINYFRDFKFSEPKWIPAGELTKEDCVLYPIIKETEDIKKINISDFVQVKKRNNLIFPYIETHTSNGVKNKIVVDGDFMRLAGYYLAEGFVHKHILGLCFNKKEMFYVNDVKKIFKKKFGIEPTIKFEKNVCKIMVYSKILSSFFGLLFGKYSYKKNIPHWMMLSPLNKQKELIKGMWRGDGCLREKDFCYVTNSRKLAYQLRDLILRQKIIPSIQIRDKDQLNRDVNRIEGRLVGFNYDKYHILVGGQFLEKFNNLLETKHPLLKNKNRKISQHAWIKDNFAVLPIRDIELTPYSGNVFNLAVETNQTYIAKNFLVHNCDATMFRGKDVVVVGCGDSGINTAILLSEYAKKVYVTVRSKVSAAKKYSHHAENTKKIEFLTNTHVKEIKGDNFVNSVVIEQDGKEKALDVQGVFVEIGVEPNTELAKKLKVDLDKGGNIKVNDCMETNIEGFFAAGDITSSGCKFKQLITSAAEGARAANGVYSFLNS